MVKISKDGSGKTLYIELSIFPNGNTRNNLTISCPDKDTKFKTSLSDNGLKKFRQIILDNYNKHIPLLKK